MNASCDTNRCRLTQNPRSFNLVQLRKMNVTPLAVYSVKWPFSKGCGRRWKWCHTLELFKFQSASIRPLKWARICLRTPGGSKNTSGQSWKNKKLIPHMHRWILFCSFNFDGLYFWNHREFGCCKKIGQRELGFYFIFWLF